MPNCYACTVNNLSCCNNLVIQKHDFKKSNISKDQVAFSPCQPRVHYTVPCPMQQKRETTDLRTCEILAYISHTQGGKKDFKGLKGLKGSLCQDSSNLNVSHHICTFGTVTWVFSWQLWKREDRKRPERKEPVFPTIQPQEQEKWLFSGCRERRSLET